MAQFFSSCNPFLSWPALKAKDTDNYSRGIVVRKVVLNKTEALFQAFLSFQCVCSLLACAGLSDSIVGTY